MMKMMQKMYEEGDDNMKRTIAEAFAKAQEGKQWFKLIYLWHVSLIIKYHSYFKLKLNR